MKRISQRNQKRQRIRKATLTSLALIVTAFFVNTLQPGFQWSDVLAQSSPNLTAEELRAAKDAARARGRERARESAREAKRLFPQWNQPFNQEMVNYLRTQMGVTSVSVNGKTLGQIITTRGAHSLRGGFRVDGERADGKDCVSCHGDPATVQPARSLVGIDEEEFCRRVPGFLRVNRPINHAGHKPRALKFFFGMWRQRACGAAG